MTAEQFSIEYQKGYGRTLGFLRSKGQPIQDCEELAQEAWTKAWAKRHTFRGESSFLSWVTSIAFTSMLLAFKKNRRYVALEDVTSPDSTHRIDATIDAETLLSRLQPAPAMLLYFRYIEDYHGDELAVRAGITSSAMKTRLFRAVQAGRLCVKR